MSAEARPSGPETEDAFEAFVHRSRGRPASRPGAGHRLGCVADNATILASSADDKALLARPAAQSRSACLAVTGPVLIRAYGKARPGAGRPACTGPEAGAAAGLPPASRYGRPRPAGPASRGPRKPSGPYNEL